MGSCPEMQECRRAQGQFMSYSTTNQWVPSVLVVKPLFTLVGFSSENFSTASSPLSPIPVTAAHSFSVFPIPSSSPRLHLPRTLLSLHMCLLLLSYYVSCPCCLFLSWVGNQTAHLIFPG